MIAASRITKVIIGTLVGAGALAGFTGADGSDTSTAISYCNNEDLGYESRIEHTDLIPRGEEVIVQQGKDGTTKVCYDDNDDELTREVDVKPTEQITVVGDGDIPEGAVSEFGDSDYIDNWSLSDGKITRNFTQEVTTAYYKELREEAVSEYYERSGAICRDGTRSYSTGRGTCSWHGGVDYWLD